jgi:hypothetical protein
MATPIESRLFFRQNEIMKSKEEIKNLNCFLILLREQQFTYGEKNG